MLDESSMPEADARILAFEVEPELETTLADLADRANEGLLTDVERVEYLEFIEIMDLLAIRQLEALRIREQLRS
jgi:hypothetical protein